LDDENDEEEGSCAEESGRGASEESASGLSLFLETGCTTPVKTGGKELSCSDGIADEDFKNIGISMKHKEVKQGFLFVLLLLLFVVIIVIVSSLCSSCGCLSV
jgi:hypothetical protein